MANHKHAVTDEGTGYCPESERLAQENERLRQDIRTLISLFENRSAHFSWCSFRAAKAQGKVEPCNCGQEDANRQVEAIFKRLGE